MAAGALGLAASDIGAVPGWYGKLPSLGDFASRRLEGDFIEPWDLWLAERLQGLRDARPESWLDAYLHSPPWRFLLTPGLLGGSDRSGVLAGVLLSSVDRVGRCFPLTIVAALPRVPASAPDLSNLLAWMQRVEDTAMEALHREWDVDALENALGGLAPPGRDAAVVAADPLAAARQDLASALAGGGGCVELAPAPSRQDLASVIAAAMDPASPTSMGRSASAPMLRGIGLWLAQRPERQRILVTHGLPAPHEFFLMFGEGGQDGEVRAGPVSAPILQDADLLGMFDTAAPGSGPQAPAAQGDVLGLFTKPSDPKKEDQAGDETRPGDHDILALFDALPGSGGAPSGEAKTSSEPDILDLFGAKPGDDGKTI